MPVPAYSAIKRDFESSARSEFQIANDRAALFTAAARRVPKNAPPSLRWAYEWVERSKVGLPVPLSMLTAAEAAISKRGEL